MKNIFVFFHFLLPVGGAIKLIKEYMNTYMNKAEVCEKLQISKKFLNTLIKRGELRAIIISERVTRFDEGHINEWLKSKSVGGLK